MARIRRLRGTRSPPIGRFRENASWRGLVPSWLFLRRDNRRWTRFHILPWSQTPEEPPFDNMVPNFLGRVIMVASRLAGPILMAVASMALFWGVIKWLA